jgi:thioredoxin reductase (NADPH)
MEKKVMVYEVIIIGSGPAGLTAGMYLGRFKRKPLIIDGSLPGGQLMTTSAVDNWPGIKTVNGPDLVKDLREHAQHCGAEFLAAEIVKVDFSKQPLEIITKRDKKLLTKSVIIATGSAPRRLGVPGENEYWGNGVNVCATCDAPFYQDREAVVVGGGNSAITEGFALSKFAKKVTIIQIRDKLTANDPLTEKVLNAPNIDVICSKKVIEIKGDGKKVTGVAIEDQVNKEVSDLSTDGVFIAIGMIPSSVPFKDQIDIGKMGYIVKFKGCKTSKEGVFVAGDVADHKYRQAITASGQGCASALECEEFLNKM